MMDWEHGAKTEWGLAWQSWSSRQHVWKPSIIKTATFLYIHCISSHLPVLSTVLFVQGPLVWDRQFILVARFQMCVYGSLRLQEFMLIEVDIANILIVHNTCRCFCSGSNSVAVMFLKLRWSSEGKHHYYAVANVWQECKDRVSLFICAGSQTMACKGTAYHRKTCSLKQKKHSEDNLAPQSIQ